MKLLIDWVISEAMHSSRDSNNLRSMLPINSAGDVYFYSPNLVENFYNEGRITTRLGKNRPPIKEVKNEEKNNASNPLEFALTEIFNYYTRKYAEKHKDFENLHENLYRLGMRGYIAFVKDM